MSRARARYVVANPHSFSASGPKRARACPRRPVVRCACRAREPGPWRPRNHRDRPAQSPGSVCTSSQTLTFHGPSLDNARSPGRKSARKHRVQSSAPFRRVEQGCRKCILRPGSLEPPSRHGARRSRTLSESHVANFHATPREIHSNDRGRNQRFRDPCSRPRKGAELWTRCFRADFRPGGHAVRARARGVVKLKPSRLISLRCRA